MPTQSLWQRIQNKEPVKVYLENEYYDTFEYVEEKNIYQGQFGYLDMKDVMEIALNGNDKIRLESVN